MLGAPVSPVHWFNWKVVSVPAVTRDEAGPLPAPLLAAAGGSSAGEPAAIWGTAKLKHPGIQQMGHLRVSLIPWKMLLFLQSRQAKHLQH